MTATDREPLSHRELLTLLRTPPNPFLDVPIEPKPPQLAWPMAPWPSAIRAIVSARMAELWALPDAPEFDLGSWFVDRFDRSDPLAAVRRELQAWLDGPTCPQRSESPWVGVMGRESGPSAHEAVFGHGFSLDCLALDE